MAPAKAPRRKKNQKNFYPFGARFVERPRPVLQGEKSFFASFFSKKEVLAFFLLAGGTAAWLIWLMAGMLAGGGWTVPKALILVCFVPIAPWVGICVGNAVLGFAVLMGARDPAAASFPVKGDFETGAIAARTALAVTVRDEDLGVVLPPLRRLMDELGDPHFEVWVLSDSREDEAASVAAAGFRYRRRAVNTGFKAGNVMEFLERHAEGIELVVMLDADSVMSASAVRRLVRIMQADTTMGIVQHLTVGLPAASAFPRLFQFGMRAGMRVWATGQGVWQGRQGPYWGHNAVLRAAAFREHGKLAPLPDGSLILSHDQVEAAQLAAAGFGVAVWAGEEGSQEANPPAFPEFLQRDVRWLAGNLQYRWLLFRPGFRAMGRWQLVQAILLFAGAPFHTAIMLLAAWSAARGDAVGAVWPVALGWALALYSPKLLGYVEVLASRRLRAAYGGGWRFAAGAVLEIVFSLLMDPVATPHKTFAMVRLALGRRAGWLGQNRVDRGVGWGEAARMFWPHTLLGVAVFAGFAAGGWGAVLWAAPFAGGAVLAIPFCVVTASAGFSGWLRRWGIAAVPEEVI
jgi:membrane glycosyltransferase